MRSACSNKRAYKQAEPILRALLKHGDDGGQIALNLGMMLSDQQRLDEAIELLQVASSKMPESANTWNALGVAYQRQRNRSWQLRRSRKSHQLAPDNAYTLRNLGALLSESDSEAALRYLRRATELLPTIRHRSMATRLHYCAPGDTARPTRVKEGH